jgi:hypothetical protein
MSLDIAELTSLVVRTLDRNQNGKVEAAEAEDFLTSFASHLAEAMALSSSADRPSLVGAPESPAHDLKTHLNESLADVATELGLHLTSIDGARYPGVAELRPVAGGVTSEQARLRGAITEALVQRLSTDPSLPDGFEVRVENPDAASGADRIAVRAQDTDWLVFDVITGSGILKARIAKSYLASESGMGIEQVQQQQLDLLQTLAGRIASQAAGG